MWAFVAPAHIPLANTQHATIAKITAWKHTTPEVKSMGRYVQASSRKGGKQKPTNNNTALHLKDNLLNLAYKIVIKCDHLCPSSSLCHFLVVVMLLLLSHFSCVRLYAPCGLQPARLLSPWDFPAEATEVGCHALFQGIFPTQGLNSGLLH